VRYKKEEGTESADRSEETKRSTMWSTIEACLRIPSWNHLCHLDLRRINWDASRKSQWRSIQRKAKSEKDIPCTSCLLQHRNRQFDEGGCIVIKIKKKGTPWGPLGVADPAGLGTSPPLKAQGHTDVGNPLGTPDKESRCGQGFNVEYKQSDECQIWMDV
jgi:hypothetical protein